MELKPCPFCGDAPYTAGWNHISGELTQPTAQVRCNCGVSGPERYGNDAASEAEKIWNHRDKADLRKIVEEMKDECQSVCPSCGDMGEGWIERIEKLLDGRMSENKKMFLRLADELVDDVLSATDEEIMSDAVEADRNVDKIVSKVTEIIENNRYLRAKNIVDQQGIENVNVSSNKENIISIEEARAITNG